MDYSIESRNSALIITGVIMCFSSFVLLEPSPFDLMVIAFIGYACLSGNLTFSDELVLPLFFLLLFLLINILSSFGSEDFSRGLFYGLITVYLAFSWLGLVGLIGRFGADLYKYVFTGYTIAAVLSAMAGIASYFGFLPLEDSVLSFGRVKGFFKDPNVFGPFLIPPILFCLSRLFENKNSYKRTNLITLLILVGGVFLSFSRAAWGHMLISAFIFYLIMPGQSSSKKIKSILQILLVALPFAIVLFLFTDANSMLESRTSLQGYDSDRFETQNEAFNVGFSKILGIGPGQSEGYFNYSTHSLYARIISENGAIGLLAFLLFYLLSIAAASIKIKSAGYQSGVYLSIVSAALIGLLFNSFFIDTLHWRHLWLLLALSWLPLTNNLKAVHKSENSPINN
ncbi:O-antigen ligase family protein [Metabacillus sp. FJAT-52054]|uniref:O-antigen ligase family protein n=1 Tax=Metabacillus sediminis TaxID=3117746 RepID=A0ABZ2NCS0_9BACI